MIIRPMARMRIIPAYAGSTVPYLDEIANSGDHPRVCGEHGLVACRLGSIGRIIPAYAGSTYESVVHILCDEDHPRVCGEHHAVAIVGPDGIGSSPRMRGALCLFRIRFGLLGIIPAYAGSTDRWNFNPQAGKDHPRVCGEHCTT